MDVRQLVRGQLSWSRLEAVAREIGARYGEPAVRVTFLEADNWLSTPCVVNERWFVKVVSEQNSLVHAILTTGRNLGAFTSGTEGFFQYFGTPMEMAEHELAATRRMRELGVNAPEPVEAFEFDGLGVLVLEYLPDYRTLDELDAAEAERLAPTVFDWLARMHDAGLAHGDFREENVVVCDGALYFIDATSVSEEAIDDASAYDVACALGSLAPHIGAGAAVAAASESFSAEELLRADTFLDFVNMRPDLDFDGAVVKGEIEKLTD